jgi:hypothetical protein
MPATAWKFVCLILPVTGFENGEAVSQARRHTAAGTWACDEHQGQVDGHACAEHGPQTVGRTGGWWHSKNHYPLAAVKINRT